MDVGLLLLRLLLGALFVGHGTQKLFGLFGGHGPERTAGFMHSLGYRPGRRAALLAGTAETTAGVLLVLGFLTPVGSAIVVGVMLNAILAVHLPNGVWNTEGGYEMNLVYAMAALMPAFAGPGVVSMDAALGLTLRGAAWGLGALGLGVLVGLVQFHSRVDEEVLEAEAAEQAPQHRDRAA
jgi:putative oxidoreductase